MSEDPFHEDNRHEVRDARIPFVMIDVPTRRLWSKENAHLGLKPSSFLVYSALVERANQETKRCFPSIAKIAEDTGQSESTVISSIKALRSVGLVSVEKQRNKLGYERSIYTVRSTPVKSTDSGSENQNRPGPNSETGPDQILASNHTQTNQMKKEPYSSVSDENEIIDVPYTNNGHQIGLDGNPTTVPSKKSKSPQKRTRAMTYPLAATYWKAKGVASNDVTKEMLEGTVTTFMKMPASITEDDVFEFVSDAKNDPFWGRTGALQAHHVPTRIVEWIASGRVWNSGSGGGQGRKPGHLTHDDWMRQAMDMEDSEEPKRDWRTVRDMSQQQHRTQDGWSGGE